MSREDSRKGLLKFMGKIVKYQATAKDISGNRILIVGVSQFGKNKILADHLWIDRGHNNGDVELGTKIMFNALAGSYLDMYDIRKYNLYNIRDIAPYDNSHETVKHDSKYYRRGK